MGKSYRKHSIIGIGGESNKKDKQIINRQLRRKVRQILRQDIEDIENVVLPIKEETMNTCDMTKEGKVYISKETPGYNKLMRK
jgi:hypothetical protein